MVICVGFLEISVIISTAAIQQWVLCLSWERNAVVKTTHFSHSLPNPTRQFATIRVSGANETWFRTGSRSRAISSNRRGSPVPINRDMFIKDSTINFLQMKINWKQQMRASTHVDFLLSDYKEADTSCILLHEVPCILATKRGHYSIWRHQCNVVFRVCSSYQQEKQITGQTICCVDVPQQKHVPSALTHIPGISGWYRQSDTIRSQIMSAVSERTATSSLMNSSIHSTYLHLVKSVKTGPSTICKC